MRFNQFKKICSVILALAMVQTLPLTSFASKKEKFSNEDVVDEIVFNPQLVDESLRLEQLPDELYAILENDIQDSVQIDEKTVSDLFSVGFVNSDGTKSLMTFDSPVKYLDDETGSICFIDNAFISTDDDNNVAYANHGNSYNANFPVNISDGVSFSEADFSINMKPADALENREPQIVNNELVYDNAFNDNTDICYSLENSGIKESIIVYEPTGYSCYDFIISADGLVPETESGKSITLLDESNGEPVFVIQPTFIMDSYNGEYIDGEEHITYDNYYDIEQQDDGTYLLHMNLDEDFLNSESTMYPCVIDPSIWAVDLYNNSSSYVQQSGGYGYVNNELSAGHFNGSGEHISYVKVNDVDKFRWIEPNRLKSAEFRVKAASSGYTNACTIDCYDSMVNLPVTSVYYSQLVSSLGEWQSSTTFTTLGSTYSFDVTNLFKQWITYELGEGGKDPAYGLILKGATGASTPGRRFSSTSSPDSYFYLIYEEGEEIEDGFYNIRNVSTGKYLKYNNGGQLSLSSYPSTDVCKWQAILKRSDDRSITYGVYTLSPYNDLNVSMKGVTTNDAVTTNSSGNTFRIIRNADGTFRIMPAGDNYARVSNAIGVNSNYASIQEYSNISSMKWTFEPVVNRFFSEYTPEKYNNFYTHGRLNCYAYAFGFIENYYISEDGKQQPGLFAADSDRDSVKSLDVYNNMPELMNNFEDNMNLDASRFGYTITEYIPNGDTVEQFGSNSRLIALVISNSSRYHFYMQHNDGTWSHKNGDDYARNTAFSHTESNPKYLNNGNIKQYVYNSYELGMCKFFIITKDAVSDYPHDKSNSPKQNIFYLTDMAGDNMFTSSSLSIGEQEGCIDTYNDIDFYVFKPTATRNYTIQTTSFRKDRNGVIGYIDVDDLDCEIYDKNGSLVYYDKIGGQVNKQFNLIGGQNYFIKIYNYSEKSCNYTITLS